MPTVLTLTGRTPGTVTAAPMPAWSFYPDSPTAYPDYGAFPGPGLDPVAALTPGTLTLVPR